MFARPTYLTDAETVYVNSVLANLNARAFVVDAMALEDVDHGPFGSGQNPYQARRKQQSTPAGPSSRDRAQVRLPSSPLRPS